MVDIIENRDAWKTYYDEEFFPQFMQHYQDTGEMVYKGYEYVNHEQSIAGKGIDLSNSRLAFISSGGAYLTGTNMPFDAANPRGDYSLRLLPQDTTPDQIAIAHDHYQHDAVLEDMQVLMPLRHLEALRDEGVIGELAPNWISYSGYHPDVTQVVDVLAPQILGKLKEMDVQAALLVPS